MKPVSRALLERLQHLAPATAEVVPLEWDHDGEDHNIAVFVDNGEDRQALEERLLETVMDYDEAHGTFTVCLVWPKEKRTLAGIR
jgi:methylaspartate ammonia-lyase